MLLLFCRLQIVSDNYHRFLSKKKALDDLPEEPGKVSARDAFGIVMISHGEEFGEDSAFGTLPLRLARSCGAHKYSLGNRSTGTSLVKFGQGMCRLATLQETQALTFKDTFSASLKMYHDEIKEYHIQRKKLESRRCVMFVHDQFADAYRILQIELRRCNQQSRAIEELQERQRQGRSRYRAGRLQEQIVSIRCGPLRHN